MGAALGTGGEVCVPLRALCGGRWGPLCVWLVLCMCGAACGATRVCAARVAWSVVGGWVCAGAEESGRRVCAARRVCEGSIGRTERWGRCAALWECVELRAEVMRRFCWRGCGSESCGRGGAASVGEGVGRGAVAGAARGLCCAAGGRRGLGELGEFLFFGPVGGSVFESCG